MSTDLKGAHRWARRSMTARRPSRAPSGVVALAVIAVLTITATLTSGALPLRLAQASTDDDLDCGSAQVSHTLAAGSAWRMCARVDDIKGLVLEQVQFRPATGEREHDGWLPVLDSLYLAQLNVPYDSGTVTFNDLTDFGFGGEHLLPQTDATCPGTIKTVDQAVMIGSEYSSRTLPGLCLDEVGTGLAWHSREGLSTENGAVYTQQGSAWEVSTITKISWYEYQQKVTLSDQGSITVALGATGDLSPTIFVDDPAVTAPVGNEHVHDENPAAGQAGSHWHNAVYRVDFGIGTGAQQVQQWDYTAPDPQIPTRVEGSGTIRTQAFSADDDPDPQTWWRVLNPTSLNPDGHARSYEIVNDSIQNPYDALTRPKVSFTNDHPCQEYASENLDTGCPGDSVADYVAAETDPLNDPVAWVSVGFHHIARDEDQSPMPSHWQQFSLVPRDLLSQQATTPIERSCINGGPLTLGGSCAAVNTAAPSISINTLAVQVGTVLTSTTGSWAATRAPLTHEWLWLRNGEPIQTDTSNGLPTAATGPRYVVTQKDVGTQITVQVTASANGIVPGSALSDPVLVPRAVPTPTPSQVPSAQPSSTPSKSAVTVRVRVVGSGKRQLRVRVTPRSGGMVRGTVSFRRKGWVRSRPLRSGTTRIVIPKEWRAKWVTVVVTYSGDARHQRAQAKVRFKTSGGR